MLEGEGRGRALGGHLCCACLHAFPMASKRCGAPACPPARLPACPPARLPSMQDLTQELLKLSVLYTALELSDKVGGQAGHSVCVQLALL